MLRGIQYTDIDDTVISNFFLSTVFVVFFPWEGRLQKYNREIIIT